MVFSREKKKMIRPIRIANNVFSRVKKIIRPIRSHRGVWVSRQNFRLLLQLAAPLRTHSTRKVLLKEFFSLKKWKTYVFSEIEWNCFVCFTVDKENGREPAKQQRKGINRTRRKLLLCFLSELLCLSFKLKCYCQKKPGNSKRSRSAVYLHVFTVWKLPEKINNHGIWRSSRLIFFEISLFRDFGTSGDLKKHKFWLTLGEVKTYLAKLSIVLIFFP